MCSVRFAAVTHIRYPSKRRTDRTELPIGVRLRSPSPGQGLSCLNRKTYQPIQSTGCRASTQLVFEIGKPHRAKRRDITNRSSIGRRMLRSPASMRSRLVRIHADGAIRRRFSDVIDSTPCAAARLTRYQLTPTKQSTAGPCYDTHEGLTDIGNYTSSPRISNDNATRLSRLCPYRSDRQTRDQPAGLGSHETRTSQLSTQGTQSRSQYRGIR